MAEGIISVQCKCGKRLKAPQAAVGRKAKCPNCGNVMVVEPPKPDPVENEIDDALYDLAGQEASAGKQAAAAGGANCPSCYQPMSPGAVVCTSCGYDTRTGRKLGTETPAASAGAAHPSAEGMRYPPGLTTKVEVAKPKPSGSLLIGTIASAVLASVGALIWFGIAKGTGYEIGWIAWGVGIAAGIGMMGGYNGHSVHSGAIAAAIAVGGILLGKFMVFQWVVMPMFTKMLDSAVQEHGDQTLVVYVARREMTKKKIDPENANEAQWDKFRAEAEKSIAKMDAKTKAAESEKAKAAINQMSHDALDQIDTTALFWKTTFSPVDIVFVVIAVASAFKVATFGGEAEG
jgi:hypothetical protein